MGQFEYCVLDCAFGKLKTVHQKLSHSKGFTPFRVQLSSKTEGGGEEGGGGGGGGGGVAFLRRFWLSHWCKRAKPINGT